MHWSKWSKILTKIEVIILLKKRIKLFVISACFHWVLSTSWLYFWFFFMKTTISGWWNGLTNFLFIRLYVNGFFGGFWFLYRNAYFSFLILLIQINFEDCWFFLFSHHRARTNHRINLICVSVILKYYHFLYTFRNLLQACILFEFNCSSIYFILLNFSVLCKEISFLDLH